MKNGIIKYIVALVISIVIIIFLALYIVNSEKKIEATETKTDVVKERIKKEEKEYILTRSLSINTAENEYNFNLKFYGETLKDKSKIISVEIYLDEIILGEYIYIDPINSEEEYKSIIKDVEKDQNKLTELYLIDNHLVLNIKRFGNNYNSNLIMYDLAGLKIDEFTNKVISECKIDNINNHSIFYPTNIDNNIYYFELSSDGLELIENKIIITENGFESEKIGSFNYNEYCK